MNIQYCSCINLTVLQVYPGHAHGLSLDEGRSGRDRRECLGAPCLFPEHHLQSNILSFLLTLLGQNFCAHMQSRVHPQEPQLHIWDGAT